MNETNKTKSKRQNNQDPNWKTDQQLQKPRERCKYFYEEGRGWVEEERAWKGRIRREEESIEGVKGEGRGEHCRGE